jgi:hypothetical protein
LAKDDVDEPSRQPCDEAPAPIRRRAPGFTSPLSDADYDTYVLEPATDRCWFELATTFLLNDDCNAAADENGWQDRVRAAVDAHALRELFAQNAVEFRLRAFDQQSVPKVAKAKLEKFLRRLLRPMALHLAGQQAPRELVEEYSGFAPDADTHGGILHSDIAGSEMDDYGLRQSRDLLVQLADLRDAIADRLSTEKRRSVLVSATNRLEELINQLNDEKESSLELTYEAHRACSKAFEFLGDSASENSRMVCTYTAFVLELAGYPGRPGAPDPDRDPYQARYDRVRKSLQRYEEATGTTSGGRW